MLQRKVMTTLKTSLTITLSMRKIWVFKMDSNNPASENLFESTFNKDLDLAPYEVPTVIFELHENSLLYMDREEWDKALILLQKAQVLVDQTKFKKDRLIIVIIFHNTAL